MTVTPLGQMTLGSALPGLSQAVQQLQSSIEEIQTLKSEKLGALGEVGGQAAALQSLLDKAQGLLDQGNALIAKVDSVLSQAQGLVGSLSGSLNQAGVGLYRFEGDFANLGAELSEYVSGQGFAMITTAQDGGASQAIRSVFRLG